MRRRITESVDATAHSSSSVTQMNRLFFRMYNPLDEGCTMTGSRASLSRMLAKPNAALVHTSFRYAHDFAPLCGVVLNF